MKLEKAFNEDFPPFYIREDLRGRIGTDVSHELCPAVSRVEQSKESAEQGVVHFGGEITATLHGGRDNYRNCRIKASAGADAATFLGVLGWFALNPGLGREEMPEKLANMVLTLNGFTDEEKSLQICDEWDLREAEGNLFVSTRNGQTANAKYSTHTRGGRLVLHPQCFPTLGRLAATLSYRIQAEPMLSPFPGTAEGGIWAEVERLIVESGAKAEQVKWSRYRRRINISLDNEVERVIFRRKDIIPGQLLTEGAGLESLREYWCGEESAGRCDSEIKVGIGTHSSAMSNSIILYHYRS